MAPAIGIDLGTTNSCVAVFKDDQVTIIPNGSGNLITPSYVAFTDKGRLIGDEAKNQAAINAKNTIFDAKRLIGRRFDDKNVQSDMKKWPFEIIDDDTRPKIKVTHQGSHKYFFPEEVSSMILIRMKEIAEKFLKEPVKDAVITVPAYFNDSQRQATMDAGRIAGLNVLKLISEPTSAAIAYGLNNAKSEERNILIYDLGGGTFDVSLISIKGKEMCVKSTGGNTHLGGEDFDNNLMEYLAHIFKNTNHQEISTNDRALRRLRNACERAKKQLSALNETNVEVDAICDDLDLSVKVSRKKFEELNDTLFMSTIDVIRDCLEQARLKKSDIAEVILVGGSTRIPKIREILQAFFDGKKLNHTLNPDEAVAYGAAVHAAKLQGDKSKAIEEVAFSDVTPLSLGIEVHGGGMSILVERNTKIPTQNVKEFYNVFVGQKSTSIFVYEGEIISEATRNNLLGKFTLTGYTPRKYSQNEFDVTFHIDENGLLKVSAVEKDSNIGESIKITLDRGRLSKEEIDRIVREGETFKNEEDQQKGAVDVVNKLVRYCTDTKSKLKDLNISNNVKSLILNRCNKVLEWIDENDSETKAVYLKKKTETEEYCQKLLR